jgi:predicted MPP superfamily phosphohydrolase
MILHVIDFVTEEINLKKLVESRYQIEINRPELPAGSFRIAFLTDLHNCCNAQETERIMSILDQANPDLVLCGGDMLVAKPGISPKPAIHFMTQLAEFLRKREQTLFCGTGNHEYRAKIYAHYGNLYQEYKAPLEREGIVFLENDSRDLEVCGMPVTVVGFDLDRRYYKRTARKVIPLPELEEAIGRPRKNRLTILLAHNPAQEAAYREWGADLTLSGHYHGGVMRLGKYRGLVTPDFRVFPPYVRGLREENGHFMIIGAGIGEHTIPFRIFNPRELVTIDLRNRHGFLEKGNNSEEGKNGD